ncbi:MAG: ABC transporter ATP-binding protein [Desulfitobacterium sp.]|nr:ABC transporter ATP-binding protein [Desulfitobacterium sp.]
MENGNKFRPFLSLIRSTKIPKVALTIGLVTSIITTIVGLLIPLLTRELVDGFSLESLSIYLIAIIIAIFILQALTDGLSTYLFGYIGQKIVASLRERMWSKLIRW